MTTTGAQAFVGSWFDCLQTIIRSDPEFGVFQGRIDAIKGSPSFPGLLGELDAIDAELVEDYHAKLPSKPKAVRSAALWLIRRPPGMVEQLRQIERDLRRTDPKAADRFRSQVDRILKVQEAATVRLIRLTPGLLLGMAKLKPPYTTEQLDMFFGLVRDAWRGWLTDLIGLCLSAEKFVASWARQFQPIGRVESRLRHEVCRGRPIPQTADHAPYARDELVADFGLNYILTQLCDRTLIASTLHRAKTHTGNRQKATLPDGKPPVPERPQGGPLTETLVKLKRCGRQAELVRYLWGRVGQEAPLEQVAKDVFRAREANIGRCIRAVRRQVERTRASLENKGCPVRLIISANSVSLTVCGMSH